jgi:group II intron reverse transcriptase/maturase
MHAAEKSDGSIVPTKTSNNDAPTSAERLEGRDSTKGNTVQQNAPRTQSRDHGASSALNRVRQVARRQTEAKFTALLHHITVDLLRESFAALRRDASPGVDGVSWDVYAVDLERNLRCLHSRIHRGAYRAKPVRRALIPKADGRQRPLGIATIEDKVVQRAVVEVMNSIYEQDFLGFSYGFRPGRSAHGALDALAHGIQTRKVNFVLDADIRGFFDSIDHEWLIRFVEHRVQDRRILRLIQRWLRAGVLEAGSRIETEIGSPQGAPISPLLANIYLHYAIDLWVQQWRKRHARGEVIVVRYADDFVVGFQFEDDAVRFRNKLSARLKKFSLSLHETKTRLIRFGRFAGSQMRERGLGKPSTFNFLGFTHICVKAQNGKFVLLRRTQRERLRTELKVIRERLMKLRHLPISAQGPWLASVVRGHFAYYGVPTNIHALQAFRTQVERHWRHALRRRGQCDRTTWTRVRTLSARWIPSPRIVHPWPSTRFDGRTRGRSPVR